MYTLALAFLVAGSAATVAAVSGTNIPASTAQLAFTEPRGLIAPDTSTHFSIGERINISWTTPFDFTTLTVWEGPNADGFYVPSVLADKFSKDRTQVEWKASSLITNSPYGYHFELRKGYAPNNCDECVVNTPEFAILKPSTQITSSKTSSTRSHAKSTSLSTSTKSVMSTSSIILMPTSTSSSTYSITSTSALSSSISLTSVSSSSSPTTTVGIADANALSSATSTPSFLPHSTNSEHSLAVGLAVGFGVGVPLIIALYAILLFLYTRAHRREQPVRLSSAEDDMEHLHEKAESRSPTNSWISKFSDITGISQAASYHETFDFQAPDGSKRPGSERLFRKGEQIPGSPGRVFLR